MIDHLNPHRIYPDDTSRRIDNPPGFDGVRASTGFQRDGGDKTERWCMVNQCIHCGQEMPEGDHVCKLCREEFDRCRDKNLADRIEALEAELRVLRALEKRMGGGGG